MTLQNFINLCGDEDILLSILDDASDNELVRSWSSSFMSDNAFFNDLKQREIQSYYHTKSGDNLVMEIYIK